MSPQLLLMSQTPFFSRSSHVFPVSVLIPLLLLFLCRGRETEASLSSASGSSSSSTGSCPKACFCNALSKIVYCSRRGMTAIPDGIAADTLQLNLNGNAFQWGGTGASRANFSRYAHLEHLYLSECNVEALAVDTFADLAGLRWLDLSNNRIRVLMQYTFRGLALDHLFLNGNRNIQLLPGSFDGLMTAGLYLQDCSLKTLRPEVLESLNDTLRNLWLNGNELERLDRSFAGMFQRFQHLHLGSNPLHCGCEAVWLKEFYDKNGEVFKTSSQPSCFAPTRLKGKYFNELSLFDFRCQSPVFSNIDIMFNDTTGRLRCSSTGDPTPTLFWIQPTGKTTKYPPPPPPPPPPPGQDESPSSSSSSSSSAGRRNEAVLVLRPGGGSASQTPDSAAGMTGMYICVANNEAGNITLAVNVSWPFGSRTASPASGGHLFPPSSMLPASSSSSSSSGTGNQPRFVETVVLSAAEEPDQLRRGNASGLAAPPPPPNDRAALGATSVYLSGIGVGRAGRNGGGSSSHLDSRPRHLPPPPPAPPGAIAVQRMFSITELMCAIVVTHLCTLMASLLLIGVFYYRRRTKLSHQQHLIPTSGGHGHGGRGGGGGDGGLYFDGGPVRKGPLSAGSSSAAAAASCYAPTADRDDGGALYRIHGGGGGAGGGVRNSLCSNKTILRSGPKLSN